MDAMGEYHVVLVFLIVVRFLVGGWTNPFEQYAGQIGSFPQGSG